MQDDDLFRKKPTQARAVATVDAIFEATARILEQHGPAALNTNAIAELAGISVGTLYEYFQDKEAILISLARRELSVVPTKLLQALGKTASAEDRLTLAVRAVISAFGGRQGARKVLLEALLAHGLSNEMARPVEKIAGLLLDGMRNGHYGVTLEATPVQIFVLTRAFVGAIRAAVMEESAQLGSPALERELVALLRAYIATFKGAR